jgi:hypothetical protein
MNPSLKDIVKGEIQKLLEVNFIYPISGSKWVSPLVIVPKKNGKWHICVDYKELNKATLKDYFPFWIQSRLGWDLKFSLPLLPQPRC